MKILVTGSNGFLGSAVCAQMLASGLRVRGTQRTAMKQRSEVGDQRSEARTAVGAQISEAGDLQTISSKLPTASEPQAITNDQSSTHPEIVVVGNIDANTDWTAALEGVDAVVHLAARVHVMDDTAEDPLVAFRTVNVEGTRRLAESAAKAGVRRFVFISSIKVNGESTEVRGQESDVRNRGQSDILMFSESDTPAPADPYGISKWEAEVALRKIEAESGMEVVILRPPLLYGPGVKANFLKLIRLVNKGIPLPLGGIRNQRSLLSLTNFADLISKCVTDNRAAGHTFLVSDGDDVSSGELVARIAIALGKKPRLLPVPEGLMVLAGKLTGMSAQVDRLCGSLQIDSTYVRKSLDWTPPVSMAQELARVAEWYQKR